MPSGKLVENISRFAALLQGAGLSVSTSEVMDALAALSWVELADRQQVRAALKATLVKNPLFLPVFEAAFNNYFRPPEVRDARGRQHLAQKRAREEKLQETKEQLSFQGEPLELPDADRELYNQLRPEDQERIRDFLEKTSTGHNVDARFKPLVEKLVRSHLAYWRNRSVPLAEVMPVESTGEAETDALLAELQAQYMGLLRADLQHLDEADAAQAARLVRFLARRLASRLSRRYRQSRQARQLDIRRTIRTNITHGGAMVKLKYRRPRLTKPQLVFIGDVSGSMYRYTTFVLEFLAGLSAAVRGVEAFLFAEGYSRLPSIGYSTSLQEIQELVKEQQKHLGQETKMDAVLAGLLGEHRHLLTRRTVVIIISDTKTQHMERTGVLLQQVRYRVKSIIWLNTLPREDWDRYPGVQVLGAHCHMSGCRTLADLERVMQESLVA